MRNKFYLATAISFMLCGLNSCEEKKEQKVVPVKKVLFKHEGNLQLKNSNDSIIKELRIEIANNDYERQTGLMYRKHLDTNHGMLFIFDQIQVRSFYMKNTYIPLDIVYIDSNKTIVNIAKNTKPLDETSVHSEGAVKYVLEINAGLSDKWNLKPGDKINFSEL